MVSSQARLCLGWKITVCLAFPCIWVGGEEILIRILENSVEWWNIYRETQKETCQVCGILAVRTKPQPQTSHYVQIRGMMLRGLSWEDAAGKAKVCKWFLWLLLSVIKIIVSFCQDWNLITECFSTSQVSLKKMCRMTRILDGWTSGLTSMVNNLCPKEIGWSLFGPKENPRVHTQHSGWNPAEGCQKVGNIIAAIIYGSTYLSN